MAGRLYFPEDRPVPQSSGLRLTAHARCGVLLLERSSLGLFALVLAAPVALLKIGIGARSTA